MTFALAVLRILPQMLSSNLSILAILLAAVTSVSFSGEEVPKRSPVDAALHYLALHQSKEGSWGDVGQPADILAGCTMRGHLTCQFIAHQHDITGLAELSRSWVRPGTAMKR